MDFFVKPGSVASYGSMVQGHSGYLDKANHYTEQCAHVEQAGGGLVLQDMWASHFEAQSMACDYLNRLALVVRDSGADLMKAADMYRATDAAAAERVDGTYPGDDTRPTFTGPYRAIAEFAFPPARLTPPREPEDFDDPGGIVDTISDLLSPAKWIQEIVESVLGVNPVETAVEPWTGDWKSVAKASSAFSSVSLFCADAAKNIDLNMNLLRNDWGGHAAASAEAYFKGVATTLDSYRQGFERLRDEYAHIAKGIADLTKAVVDYVSKLMDDAFWAALEVVAGGVLVETGVGPAVLWSLAALECKGIVDNWSAITGCWEKAKYLAEYFNAAVTGISADGSYFQAHQPPGSAYHHPGVV